MIYEVRSILYFTKEDEAKDFYHDCEVALTKATIINPGKQNVEPSIIKLLENNHDTDPNSPCKLLAGAMSAVEH